jgi:cytochrome c oxidase subunit 2
MIKLSLVLAAAGLALLITAGVPSRATTTQPSQGIAPAAQSESEADYGQALFSAKGCASCHHHAAVAASGLGEGSSFPDLTTYRWTADYLRTWLKDPAAIKPATDMPNLGLKRDEIEALIAFLAR